MADKELPALSIALVDDQRIVWSRGFGFADPKRRVEATADTVYRVGSVSKLFTDLALMQLVEQGQLDLDAPVDGTCPTSPAQSVRRADHPTATDVAPLRPGARAAGRQLLRPDRALAGRDRRQPQPDDAGLSRRGRAPNTRTPRSPPSASWSSDATVSRSPSTLKRTVLDPLGMRQSSFEPTPEVRANLAKAVHVDHRRPDFPAPTFALGIAPAGGSTPRSTISRASGAPSSPEAAARTARSSSRRRSSRCGAPVRRARSDARLRPRFRSGRARRPAHAGHGGAIYGFATSSEVCRERSSASWSSPPRTRPTR